MRRFALIGFGAIAEEIVRSLEERGELDALVGALVRGGRPGNPRFPLVRDIEGLLALGPQTVVECAGHAAMRQYASAVLAHGTNLLCSSVGALADPAFEAEVGKHRARLLIPSGAVAGIDGLLAARSAGLREVSYTSVKPPAAWRGTPGESRIGPQPSVIFEGSAREAALQYPQNANVGATVALAGLGLDRTVVRLVSDPQAAGPLGLIEAEGDFGRLRFEILAYASPRNPKTSLLTAHSLLSALRDGLCFDFPAKRATA
jgi:aspartate dehydrogenase